MTTPSLLFFDTSALVSRLLGEPGCEEVEMLLDAHRKAVFVSALSVVEVLADLTRRYREGVLSREAYADVCERFGGELRGSGFVVLDFKLEDFSAVSETARRHGLDYDDAMHFAVIRKHLDVFGKDAAQYVCGDEKFLRAARDEGFHVFRPGAP